MAFSLGSEQVAKEQLINFIETPDERKGSSTFAVNGWKYPSGIAVLLTRLGLSSREGVRERMDTSIDLVRGGIALERGNLATGTDLLEKAVQRSYWSIGANPYLVVSDNLASAWEQQGEWEQAARVLEEASSKKTFMVNGGAAPHWFRIQWRLAEVYRKLGREEDALRIEEELLKLLTYADPDHPILLRLTNLHASGLLAQAAH